MPDNKEEARSTYELLAKMAARRAAVVDLWRDGLSQKEIAEKLGTNRRSVSRTLAAVRREVERSASQAKIVGRLVANTRLDLGYRRLEVAAADGDVQSIEAQRKHVESAAKLNGLNSPEEYDVKVSSVDYSKLSPEDFDALEKLLEKCQPDDEEGEGGTGLDW